MENKTLLTFEKFLKGFHLIKEVFEFDSSEIYIDAVYNALKDDMTDRSFIDICNNILKEVSKEDWNKAYGFKGRPAIRDWIDAFVPAVVEKTRYVTCKITGAMLKETYFDYPDYYLKEINQQKQVKLEREISSNENNKLPQLEALKANMIKKI